MSKERAVVLPEWPQPDAGAPTPVTIADDTTLIVRYCTQSGKVGVIYFPLCFVFTFGSPNDEAVELWIESGEPETPQNLEDRILGLAI